MDIVVGRILVDEVFFVNILVDKIIDYFIKDFYGNWRNNFVLVFDDVDEEYEYELFEVILDGIGDEIIVEKFYINVCKIYIDVF